MRHLAPAEPKYNQDPQIKDKCIALARLAQARAIALGEAGRLGVMFASAAPWDHQTCTTWYAKGSADASDGIVFTQEPWTDFGNRLKEIAKKVQPKGTGHNFTPIYTRNGRRRDIDVVSIHQLVLDCDGGGLPDKLHKIYKDAGIAYVYGPSISSTPECPKWHWYTPFDDAIRLQDDKGLIDLNSKTFYRLVNIWLITWFGVLAGMPGDLASADQKKWFGFDSKIHSLGHPSFPGARRKEDDKAPEVTIIDGLSFNLTEFLKLTGFSACAKQINAEFASRKYEPRASTSQRDWSDDEKARKAIEWISKRPPCIESKGPGNSTRCLVVIGDLVKGFSLEEEIAYDIFQQYYNPRCEPEWSESEIRHKIEAALNGTRPEGHLLDLIERDEELQQIFRELAEHLEKKGINVEFPKAAWETVSEDGPQEVPENKTGKELDLETWDALRPGVIADLTSTVGGEEILKLAMEPKILAWAAAVEEKSSRFMALGAELRVIGMAKVSAWKEAVKAKRRATAEGRRVEEQPKQKIERARIEIIAGREADANDAAVAALVRLKTVNRTVYAYGQVLANLVENRKTKQTYIHTLTEHSLRENISRTCTFYEMMGFEKPVAINVNVPDKMPGMILARGGDWPELPSLTGQVPYPFMTPSGRFVTVEGHDEETGMFLKPNFTPLPMPTDEELTPELLRDAIDLRMYLMKDFPFQDAPGSRKDETKEETYSRLSKSRHFAAWLAASLTPYTRSAYSAPSPGFAASANRRGSGKDKSKEVIERELLGDEMDTFVQSVGHGDEAQNEDRKRIMALVLKGTPMVCVSNIEKAFGNATWAQALTATAWSDRALGTSTAPTCPMRITWFFNGNHLEWLGDMGRRIIQYTFETPHNKPEKREDLSEPDLLDWVRENRAELVRASLIILRAWTKTQAAVADLPNKSPTGSYNEWSKIVRGAILNAGLADPWDLYVAGNADDRSDADGDAHKALLDGLIELMNELKIKAIGAGDILTLLTDNDDASASWRLAAQRSPVRYLRLREAIAAGCPRLKEGVLPSRDQFTKNVLGTRVDSYLEDGRVLRHVRDSQTDRWVYRVDFTKPDQYPEPRFDGKPLKRTYPKFVKLVPDAGDAPSLMDSFSQVP